MQILEIHCAAACQALLSVLSVLRNPDRHLKTLVILNPDGRRRASGAFAASRQLGPAESL